MCARSLTLMQRSRPAFSVASRRKSIPDNLTDAMRPRGTLKFPCSVMVTQQILDLLLKVRVLPGELKLMRGKDKC